MPIHTCAAILKKKYHLDGHAKSFLAAKFVTCPCKGQMIELFMCL